ncbi:GLPGLI family protein [Muriicola sp. Z0-33]|uniref:GLPGLI family protein n=1 Tax=Muriicola sp. Z0-33 TaxID=2816957 RepID=UPI002237D20F|nr:GLPGLI family protein [Muriicola sp. Z0-33]MCW5518008.1 GLPGLI family protein [Muriicola sp. Z0-33]
MKYIMIFFLLGYSAVCSQDNSMSDVKVEYEVFKILDNTTRKFSSILLFNASRSLFNYKIDAKNEEINEVKEFGVDQFRLNVNREVVDTLSNSYYYEYRRQHFIRSVQDFNSQSKVFIQEPIQEQEWEIASDTKKIQSFDCLKATLEYKGNRYIAWFTRDIPTTFGPFEFGQLLGLILELYSEDRKLYLAATKVVYPFKQTMDAPSSDADYISNSQYEELLQKYQDSITNSIEEKARRILTKSDRSVHISNIRIEVKKSNDSTKINSN